MPPKKIDPKIRFWKFVQKNDIKSCWKWVGGKSKSGYGRFNNTQAHRFSYELKYGQIPKDMLACHKCDIRDCVNPDHIFIGTYRDNILDCVKKGRQNNADVKGENNARAKLTEKQVIKIRELHDSGKMQNKQLSEKFNTPVSTIEKIVGRETWKHI